MRSRNGHSSRAATRRLQFINFAGGTPATTAISDTRIANRRKANLYSANFSLVGNRAGCKDDGVTGGHAFRWTRIGWTGPSLRNGRLLVPNDPPEAN